MNISTIKSVIHTLVTLPKVLEEIKTIRSEVESTCHDTAKRIEDCDLDDIKCRLTDLDNRIDDLDEPDLGDIESRLDDLEYDSRNHDERLGELEDQPNLTEIDERIEALEANLEGDSPDFDGLLTKIDELTKRVKELENSYPLKETEIKRFTIHQVTDMDYNRFKDIVTAMFNGGYATEFRAITGYSLEGGIETATYSQMDRLEDIAVILAERDYLAFDEKGITFVKLTKEAYESL